MEQWRIVRQRNSDERTSSEKQWQSDDPTCKAREEIGVDQRWNGVERQSNGLEENINAREEIEKELFWRCVGLLCEGIEKT